MKPGRASLAALVFGTAIAISLTTQLGGDYPGPACPICDYAGPPLEALARGHIATFFHTQTIMGSVSMLLRAPLVALSYVGPHSLRWEYRLGSLVGLLAVAILAWWLTRIMERQGRSWFARALVAALCVAGPLTFRSLFYGHPEELLAGAMCVSAVLLALRGRPLLAGTVVGLAIATKPWALLAVPVVVMATSDRRLRLAGTSLAVAALFTVPMMLGDPHRFWTMVNAYGTQAVHVTPGDIWWTFGHQNGLLITNHGNAVGYVVPDWIATLAHPLVVLLTLVLAGGFWASRRTTVSGPAGSPPQLLQLLALILLLRSLLDPGTFSYYHVPFLLALVASECLAKKPLPYLALLSTATFVFLDRAGGSLGLDGLHDVYLGWALPMTAWLTITVFGSREPTGGRLPSAVAVPAPSTA